jgi:14-3-3 protein epsilon
MIIMSDMVEFMKNLARMDVDMSAEERHLFSVGFKNTIGAKRASWRIICSHKQKVAADRQTGVMIDAYKKKVEEELRKVCNEVLSVIAIHCLPLASTGGNIVFFYKMYVQVPRLSKSVSHLPLPFLMMPYF